MIEYAVGAAVAVYLCGVAFFMWDELKRRPWRETRWQRFRRNWWYVPVILVWPLAVVIAPITRRVYAWWRWER